MRGTFKFKSQLALFLAALLFLTLAAQAQTGGLAFTSFTSRRAMGADTLVDWGVLGATLPTVTGLILPNPFPTAASTNGLVTVNGLQPLGAFARLDEGINWHGDFAPGDHLMSTDVNAGPVTITFVGGPVFGAGIQLQMQPLGPFIASLTAFDSNGAVIATLTANGNSTSPTTADNSAPFLGIRTPVAAIAKIEVSCLVSTGRGNIAETFAMNQLSVATKAAASGTAAHDFNGDGKSDILWRNSATGDNVIWLMNGTSITSGNPFSNVADLNWQIVGAGDFNGDGKADILWRNSVTGDNVMWLMNGASITTGAAFSNVADSSWHIVGVGDFNGDGKADILWRNSVTGDNVIWLMNGASIGAGAAFSNVADPNWHVVGVADYNGDGKADILWRNSLTGDNVMWLMNGTSIATAALLSNVPDANWHVVGVGDFNGDGKADILWRNSASGDNVMWLMNGTSVTTGALFSNVADPNWKVAGVRDFNGDGNADIVWRNSVTGDNVIWLMNGTTITSGAAFSNVAGASWQIVP